MNESIRVAGSKAPVLCAPYASPSSAQEFLRAASFAPADATATPGAAAAPWAHGAFAPAPQTILVPYVPREFRRAAESDTTGTTAEYHEPTDRHLEASFDDLVRPPEADSWDATVGETGTAQNRDLSEVQAIDSDEVEAEPAGSFASTEAEPADSFASQAALFAAVDVPEPQAALDPAVELPWIDAFAEDSDPSDETWPMDDAGRRLDELALSLGSLDASRARATGDENEQEVDSVAEEENGVGLPPDAPVSMWSEDEWIDIMPLPEAAESTRSHAGDLADHSAELTSARVESAARALEGLAQRVREGGLPVPSFPSDIADEAMLAGLLASMLGWRQ